MSEGRYLSNPEKYVRYYCPVLKTLLVGRKGVEFSNHLLSAFPDQEVFVSTCHSIKQTGNDQLEIMNILIEKAVCNNILQTIEVHFIMQCSKRVCFRNIKLNHKLETILSGIFRHILKHDSLKRMVSEVESTLYSYHIFTLVLNFNFNSLYFYSFLNFCVFILYYKDISFDLKLFPMCKHYWICYVNVFIPVLCFYCNEQMCS